MFDSRSFPQRLKYALNIRGFAQVDLAQYLGISSVSMSSYTNGKFLPDKRRLARMAEFLNVSMRWLITGEGDIDDKPEAMNLMMRMEDTRVRIRRDEHGISTISIRLSEKEEKFISNFFQKGLTRKIIKD